MATPVYSRTNEYGATLNKYADGSGTLEFDQCGQERHCTIGRVYSSYDEWNQDPTIVAVEWNPLEPVVDFVLDNGSQFLIGVVSNIAKWHELREQSPERFRFCETLAKHGCSCALLKAANRIGNQRW